MRKYKKLFYFILSFSLLLTSYFLLPVFTYAQGGFIPCDGVEVKCDFPMLMQLISNVMNYIVLMAFPLAIITIAYAGFTYMTTGISDKKSKARTMLLNVVIGFAVLLAAWVIVRTMLTVFVKDTIVNNVPLKL